MTTSTTPSKINLQIDQGRVTGALLGAAIGDALGWPQERPDLRLGIGGRKQQFPQKEFQQWRRRVGGRYRAYEEVIQPGEYSDDTQLILATARSLLHGKNWSSYLVRQEFPIWLLYERGGGQTVKRAAQSWAAIKPPWSESAVLARNYFGAGANGAAMRVLPHALLVGVPLPDMLRQVILNGALTHGHPRALLGAALYSQAARFLLSTRQPLSFGALVDYLLDNRTEWGQFQKWEEGFDQWWYASKHLLNDPYEVLWNEVVIELEQGLARCQEELRRGALADSRAYLDSIGAFNPNTNGAGTVAALAAVYFASAFAADPVTGMLEAAFTYGSDTDTIAAMTGGLLGALLGTDWLAPEWLGVQDRTYIETISQQIGNMDWQRLSDGKAERWRENDRQQVMKQLANTSPQSTINLGSLGITHVVERFRYRQITKTLVVQGWKLQSEGGQTLYIAQPEQGQNGATTVPSSYTQRRQADIANKSAERPRHKINLFQLIENIPGGAPLSLVFRTAADIATVIENDLMTGLSTRVLTQTDLENYAQKVISKLAGNEGLDQPNRWLAFVIALVQMLKENDTQNANRPRK